MKDFNISKFFIAAIVVYIAKQILDFLVHGLILGPTYEKMTDVWRPDMDDKMWVMYVTGIVFSLLFVYIYHFFSKGHFKTGLTKGFCYGLLIGLLMIGGGMFNDYATFNLTSSLVWQWFIYVMIQMIIYGLLVSLIYKPKQI